MNHPAPDLDNIFRSHAPTNKQQQRYEEIRAAARNFARVMIDHTPPGADQSAALRKIREAVMTANAAIALDGKI